MILSFYIALNAISIYLFAQKKKQLHIIETIVYWMISSYLFQNFSAMCYMNFKTLVIPEKLGLEFTHVLNRLVFYPLLMVTFLELFIHLRTYSKKLTLYICFILLFVGLEWLSDALGVMTHVHWRIWWSFLFWMVALLILIGFSKFFRKNLYKGSLKV